MSDYVELHANSAFSFLRGASMPTELAKQAAELGLPALALLDRDGVYGAPELYSAAQEHPVRPIVGAEITMEDGSVMPLLVLNQKGYRNLSRLISTAKLEARPPEVREAWSRGEFTAEGEQARWGHRASLEEWRGEDPRERKRPCYATWRELAAHAEGLVALTGDEEGPVLRAWSRAGSPDPAGIGKRGAAAAAGSGDPALQGNTSGVIAVMERLETIFGRDRLFVEVQRRRVRGENTAVRLLADLATARGLPLLATGGVRHATRADRAVADVFTCLRNHTTLDAAGRLLAPNGERHLRSAATMRELFADLPEAVANTARLTERLEFTLQNLGYQFPDYPVGEGETMAGVLRERVHAGARERFGVVTGKISAQIEKELALIDELKFSGYFLIVWDICRWTREHGILIQGRGSAANSVVCYTLGITAVDPIKNGLLFERFLSRGRIGPDGHPSWPDVDLDLPSGDLRESVIQQVYERYQPRGAAMVANVITYRGRSVVRELGKVMGLSVDVMDRFSALYANGDFPQTLGIEEQVKLAGLPSAHPRLPAMLAVYHRMKGLPRHLGQHSGGMVLCPNRLDSVVPIEPASMERRCVVQWNKDDCEDLGLVKIDFLGLGMMMVLQDSFRLCAERGGPARFTEIPADDPATYADICDADTIGVFQIESRAQMATLPRFRPKNLYDLAMQVSIVRPGPIVGKLVHPLIRRRQGLEEVTYLDPDIDHLVKPVLERTMGVILFQEQMLKLAMDVAGFDGSQAEELRRAMGFTKHPGRLERSLENLRAAMRQRGIKEPVIDKVVTSCRSFAAYGFPESHAISFAMLAYASTWLKVHRPAEFYASLLNNQPMGFYSPATLIQDGRRHGLKVKPVCVQASRWECTVEPPSPEGFVAPGGNAIRVGLRYVKGLQEKRARAMLAERDARAFASMPDFLARARFTAAERRSLAAVGALNALAEHRRAALWQVEAAWSAEESLLQGAGVGGGTVPLAAMTREERVMADFGGLSLTVGEHPMAMVRARLPDVWRAEDLTLGHNGETVRVAGSVICRQRPGTAKGVVFVSLEDETGIANAVVSAELFERRRMVINEEPALSIVGKLQIQDNVIHVRAERIEALRLEELPAQASHDFR